VVLAVCLLGGARAVAAQEIQVGSVDFFGLHRLRAEDARAVLTFKPGDTIRMADGAPSGPLADSERRLAALPGVVRARASAVCCDPAGRVIVYVGIEEKGVPGPRFRAPPNGSARLAADVVEAGDAVDEALMAAVRTGDIAEDAQGHALNHAPALRALQERFVLYAARDLPALRRVLRTASDPVHRRLAAQVLGYAADKAAVVGDLVSAMADPDAQVRNDAMRALMVFTRADPRHVRPRPRVPARPFIALLGSPVWTDRNKAVFALAELSRGRDPQLLARLRREALGPLAEIARWRNEGHARPAFMILGRLAGSADADTEAAFARGEKEPLIRAAGAGPP